MEELIKKAEEEGIDVEDIIINAIRNESEDPSISIKLRIEIAEKYINEAKKYLENGDIIQASEKAYKCLPVA
ncbi:PaREP1 domain protein [Acidianus hospitalis W1]|uniref:PaREP1 domain protein n=1 Tax=Acidianus hospitalis (strain W1) TaxID=933801 RepID=F4B6Z1_ACIHW|nr:PaREP1 domain protein [Acidianus hospitalis W1]